MAVEQNGGRNISERLLDGARNVVGIVSKPAIVVRIGGVIAFAGLTGVAAEGVRNGTDAEKIYPSVTRDDLRTAESSKVELYRAVDEALRKGRVRAEEEEIVIRISQITDPQTAITAQEILDRSRENEISRKEYKLNVKLDEDSIGTKGVYAFILGVSTVVAGFGLQLRRYLMKGRKNQSQQFERTSVS